MLQLLHEGDVPFNVVASGSAMVSAAKIGPIILPVLNRDGYAFIDGRAGAPHLFQIENAVGDQRSQSHF